MKIEITILLIVCLVFVNFSSSEAFVCNDHNCPGGKRSKKPAQKRTMDNARLTICDDGISLCLVRPKGPSDDVAETGSESKPMNEAERSNEARRVNNIIRRISAVKNARMRSLATDLDMNSK